MLTLKRIYSSYLSLRINMLERKNTKMLKKLLNDNQ